MSYTNLLDNLIPKQNLRVTPIISGYDLYNYRAAKYLANLIAPITLETKLCIKDAFDFNEKAKLNKNAHRLMCWLDV